MYRWSSRYRQSCVARGNLRVAERKSERFFRLGAAIGTAAGSGIRILVQNQRTCAPRDLRLRVDLKVSVIRQALEGIHRLLEHLGHRVAICRHERT